MLQKIELQQLQKLSLADVKAHKESVLKRKTELEALKAKNEKNWTQALQDELDDTAVYLVDVDEVIDEKMLEPEAQTGYVPKPGTEKLVHLSIVKGRRFNPMTGKEESKPCTQLFTFAEWQLFKKNFSGLGYSIMQVLYDPYGEAKDFVTKEN